MGDFEIAPSKSRNLIDLFYPRMAESGDVWLWDLLLPLIAWYAAQRYRLARYRRSWAYATHQAPKQGRHARPRGAARHVRRTPVSQRIGLVATPSVQQIREKAKEEAAEALQRAEAFCKVMELGLDDNTAVA